MNLWEVEGGDYRVSRFLTHLPGNYPGLIKVSTSYPKSYERFHALSSAIVEEETARVLSGAGSRSSREVSDRIQEAAREALIRTTRGGVLIATEKAHASGVLISADMCTLEQVEVRASFWNGCYALQRYANWTRLLPTVEGICHSDYDFVCTQFTEGDRFLTVNLFARPATLE